MINIFKRNHQYKGFLTAKLKETTSRLDNPYRGWFELYTYNIEEEPGLNSEIIKNSEDNLVLVLIDIGAYREKKLENTELGRIARILEFFYNNGKKIILRITYDAFGKGMEREPSSFRWVLVHAEQIAEFVHEQADKIFLYQGLLVGRWGEMHTTKFSSPEKLCELNAIFEKKIGKSIYRAVRKPVQWRLLNQWSVSESNPETKGLGVFNDGMFGSESDLGTYDPSCKDTKLWGKSWNRENEVAFISLLSQEVPYGGEALLGEGFATSHSIKDYLRDLRKLNVTYLNRHHDRKLIEIWKNELYCGNDIWDKHSLFEYIGAHLGYRFVVKSVVVTKEKNEKEIKISIENKGFANLYIDTELLLQIENGDMITEKVFSQKLNLCKAGNSIEYKEKVDLIPGKYYLSARTIGDNTMILFANNMSSDNGKVFIGEVKTQ